MLLSCFPIPVKRYMAYLASNFAKKIITTCVVKSQCKFIIYWGNFQSKKVVLEVTKNWNLGPQGAGCASPSGSARAAPSRRAQGCIFIENTIKCGAYVLLKSQCKQFHIWEGQTKKTHLGKVCKILPTLFGDTHMHS